MASVPCPDRARRRFTALAFAALLPILAGCQGGDSPSEREDDARQSTQSGQLGQSGQQTATPTSPAASQDTSGTDGDRDPAEQPGADSGTGDQGETEETTEDPATQPPWEPSSTQVPELAVSVQVADLSVPWEVAFLPDGIALITERGGRLLAHDGERTWQVSLPIDDLFVGSESGLMGMAIVPGTQTEHAVLLCHATQRGGAPQDIRVTRWSLDTDAWALSPDGVVTDGLPITSGRHGGCRLLVDGDTLYIGTGDAADPSTPQDVDSLGGKVLAVTFTGDPIAGAPHTEGADPRILSFGHRNVQGLAVHPGTGALWSVEHGPDVDDEVNIIQPGGNYGWHPGPGYDESVPMTDVETFPDAIEPVWATGAPTHALAGAAFLDGPQWGAWERALVIAELKGSGMSVLFLDGHRAPGDDGASGEVKSPDGSAPHAVEVREVIRIPALDGTYGRLRSVTPAPDGSLWITTSNGTGDQVLRLSAVE